MRRGQVEQADSKPHSRRASFPSRTSILSYPSTHILLTFLFLALPALSRSAQAGDVVLGWNANTEPQLAGYKLYYGTTSRQYKTSIDVGKVTTYTVSGLPAGTYYFALTAYSATEETAYSIEVSAVIPPPDTTPPSISGVAATAVSDSTATITWSTDEPADTQLEYGLSSSYGSVTPTDPALATTHAVALSGLTAGATYHYRVMSRDAAGNIAVSGDFSLVTSAPPDTQPPVLTSIRTLSVSNNSATIAWTSNEPADTQVEYGPSTAYGTLTALDPANVTSHSQALGGLSSGTVYHFRAVSRDPAGNLAVSADFTFTTTSLPDTASSLVAAYAFDEGSGSRATDSSGSPNFATLNNAAWTTRAKFGRALSFNGKNSFVSAGIAGLPAVDAPKTISCWLYLSGGAGGTQSAIALANEAEQASVQHEFKSSQVGILQYGGTWLVAGNPPPSKAWHHFAYTFDGSQNRFYVDGVLVSSSTLKPQAASVATLQIGRGIAGSDYFKGIIDEVRIYSRALDQEEITAAMNEPITGTLAGPYLSDVRLESADDDAESGEEPALGGGNNPESDGGSQLSYDSRVAIDIHMSQSTYCLGETVRASASRLSNPSHQSRGVELKAWLAGPGIAPVSLGEPWTDGPIVLPAGFDQDFGPLSLFEVSTDMPVGTYQLNARVIDPVTGDILNEDTNPFAVLAGEEASKGNLQAVQPIEGDPKLVLESHPADFVRAGLAELSGLRIANRGDTPAPVELKVWIEARGYGSIPVFELGGNGSLVLPAGSDLSLDPLASFRPLQNLPAGRYQLMSRIVDPTTGEILSETMEEYVVH